MKKIFIIWSAIAMMGCKNNSEDIASTAIEKFSPAVEENSVIYEVNIRQYSPEGTFNAFTKDIPQLKELGVKIIWVMPIFPISQTKRKATGGDDSKFASEMPAAEQHKYLGSYYAVSDFKKVNPEFGTIEDFRNLVKTAHKNGIYVILDWVPNHTGWDHVWIKNHPEYYTQNAKGEIIDPINPETVKSWGWTDVADWCPTITDFFKNQFDYKKYFRIRIMKLAPGGWIVPHKDSLTQAENHIGPVNVAINHPEDCHFYMDNIGILPWEQGRAIKLNLYFIKIRHDDPEIYA